MLFSHKLLCKLVDIDDIAIDDLVKKLIFSGFEVEGTKKLAEASKLVIGHVLSCVKHPDSDHMHVLKVDCGQEGVLDIVCGAPNVAKDENVIVALPGCVLPAKDETIKCGVIRGQTSNGMCCSLGELGVDKSSQSEEDLAGIHVLPKDAPVGEKDVLGYLGLDDIVLDISILPNRPDCLSHIGLAKEMSAIFNRKMKDFSLSEIPFYKSSYEVNSATEAGDKFDFIEVEINGDMKTPEEIKNYLRSLGIRSISPLVDLGNFSMILTGQPLHMYDLDKVSGKKLTIRDDYEGDFVALDDKTYKIIKGDLVICDDKKVCCLAGIMGGKDVAIDASSKHIGIEAAHFYYARIRHTSSRLGLVSDSSSLFSKGTNPYIISDSLKVTLALLKSICPNSKVVSSCSYDHTAPFKGEINFSYDILNKHLGMSLTKEEIDNDLSRFHLEVKNGKIAYDKYRLDLLEQCDIEEEIFRLEPREKAHMSLEGLDQTDGALTDKQELIKRIKENLISNGLDQIITYTLVSKKMDSELRIFSSDPSFKVNHPLTEDHEYIRSDLLSSMKASIEYNISRKNDDLQLFEVSNIDTPKGNHTYLSIGLNGNVYERGMVKAHLADFFDMKGLIEDALSILGLDERRYTFVRSKNSSFHPGKSADIVMGKKAVGTFGELSPLVSKDKMVLAELDLSFLLEQKSGKTKAMALNAIAPIRRDLAFKLLDNNVSSDDIIKSIKKGGGRFVVRSEVFDVFTKDGATYLAFASWFDNEGKPFTDAQINSLLNTIILNVTHSLKVELRS